MLFITLRGIQVYSKAKAFAPLKQMTSFRVGLCTGLCEHGKAKRKSQKLCAEIQMVGSPFSFRSFLCSDLCELFMFSKMSQSSVVLMIVAD